MSKQSATMMKKVIESILEAQNLKSDFLDSEEFTVEITSGPYVILAIERFGDEVEIAQYFLEHGFLVEGPIMGFLISTDGWWYPTSLQFSLGLSRETSSLDAITSGPQYLDRLNFSQIWAKVIKLQAFDKGRIRASIQIKD